MDDYADFQILPKTIKSLSDEGFEVTFSRSKPGLQEMQLSGANKDRKVTLTDRDFNDDNIVKCLQILRAQFNKL